MTTTINKKRYCKNYSNVFVTHVIHVCGEFAKNKTYFVKNIYHEYFSIPLGDRDKSWAPHIACPFMLEICEVGNKVSVYQCFLTFQ